MNREVATLIPAIVSANTFVELFHSLLDMPLLCAAMERTELESKLKSELNE